MKRIKPGFTLFLIRCTLLLPVLSFAPSSEVKGAELTFFEDDFESYQVGDFPHSGGWEMIFKGVGTQHPPLQLRKEYPFQHSQKSATNYTGY